MWRHSLQADVGIVLISLFLGCHLALCGGWLVIDQSIVFHEVSLYFLCLIELTVFFVLFEVSVTLFVLMELVLAGWLSLSMFGYLMVAVVYVSISEDFYFWVLEWQAFLEASGTILSWSHGIVGSKSIHGFSMHCIAFRSDCSSSWACSFGLELVFQSKCLCRLWGFERFLLIVRLT